MLDRAAVANAIVFWETGRLGFNGVLALTVLVFAILTDAWMQIAQSLALVVVLGALANVLYCAAYPIDLIAQATPWRGRWRQVRWIVWALGTLFAVILAVVAVFGVGVVTTPRPD